MKQTVPPPDATGIPPCHSLLFYKQKKRRNNLDMQTKSTTCRNYFYIWYNNNGCTI